MRVAIVLCVMLAMSPFVARAQDVVIVKNVQKTVTKTVNVNGNGNVVGNTVVVGSITNNNGGGGGGNTGKQGSVCQSIHDNIKKLQQKMTMSLYVPTLWLTLDETARLTEKK
jgi:hypothetical protein